MKLHTTPLFREYGRMYKQEADLYHDIAHSLGLSDSAFCVLYTICEMEDGSLRKDICKLFLSKQTVHSVVRRLEEEGLLRLEAGKGRDMHLYLPPAGQAAAEKIIPLSQRETAAFTAMRGAGGAGPAHPDSPGPVPGKTKDLL